MTYGKRYTFRWTPRLLRAIILLLVSIFIVGGLIGFTIGRVSIAESNVPNEQSIRPPQNEVTEQANTDSLMVISDAPGVETSEPKAPEKFYYDCPLDNALQDYIRELCEKNGVPMSLAIAMIEVESSFRPNIISDTNDYGLMQINKCNHAWLSEKYGVTDFLDPYQNVLCGITILSQHYNKYQNEDKALMAYNLGAIGAKQLWDKGVYETSYTRKVQSAKEGYENEI